LVAIQAFTDFRTWPRRSGPPDAEAVKLVSLEALSNIPIR
jgi:hypothetical protein